jgi:hypothetical protein
MGSDIVLLPKAEVHYTYQDLVLSTSQLHQWSETANTADTRAMTEPDKGRKRRKPETTDDTPTLLSPTDDLPTTATTLRTMDPHPN